MAENENKAAEAEAAKTEKATVDTKKGKESTVSLNKKSYEVLQGFRSILNYDKEYKPGDEFKEVDDKARLQTLIDRKFIK